MAREFCILHPNFALTCYHSSALECLVSFIALSYKKTSIENEICKKYLEGFHKRPVKIYRVRRPGFGKNLTERSSLPFLVEKKSSLLSFSKINSLIQLWKLFYVFIPRIIRQWTYPSHFYPTLSLRAFSYKKAYSYDSYWFTAKRGFLTRKCHRRGHRLKHQTFLSHAIFSIPLLKLLIL